MKRKYDREFKLNAIKFYEESGMKMRDVEKELGIGSGCISHWKKDFREEKESALIENGNPRDLEMMKLKKENEILKQERDILKKALGIFSQNSK